MKRDMDLVRDILLAIERDDSDPGHPIDIVMPDHSVLEVSAHIQLMDEAGLIEARCDSNLSGSIWKAKRITWAGHEFLDAARTDTVWNKAKSKIATTTGGLSLDLLKVVLVETAKDQLGIKP